MNKNGSLTEHQLESVLTTNNNIPIIGYQPSLSLNEDPKIPQEDPTNKSNNNNNYMNINANLNKEQKVEMANLRFDMLDKKTIFNHFRNTQNILKEIYRLHHKIQNENDNVQKETLTIDLMDLKEKAKIKMDQTRDLIIYITHVIQNSIIDYPFGLVNEFNLYEVVNKLFEVLKEKIVGVTREIEKTKTTIKNIKKRIEIQSEDNIYTRLSNEYTKMEELKNESTDLNNKLYILNAAVDQISIFKSEYLHYGLPVQNNNSKSRQTFQTRKQNALAKNSLLNEYIQIIGDKRSTNKKGNRYFRNLSKNYNSYTEKFKKLNPTKRNYNKYGASTFEKFIRLPQYTKYMETKKKELHKKGTAF